MSNNAKLKKKAAEFEAKKQFDKALELYEQVLTTARAADEERDVPLYNRVGDIHYRLGNIEQAMGYYEQAADLYAEGGFFNNAIALCNKILRYSPGRTVIYYKLGIISAKKGFNSDAKQNFLEYADRMQKLGKMDEAFRALKEFADLCPGQDDVRLMLADQLARADRKPEALEQLEILYDTLEAEGRSGEATATLERMKALDPLFKPQRSATPAIARKKEGLVFLDLDFESAAAAPSDSAPTVASGATINDEAAVADTTEESAPESILEQETVAPEGFVVVPRAEVPEGLELTSLADESIEAGDAEEENFGSEVESELVFLSPPDNEDDTAASDIPAPMDLDTIVDLPDFGDAEAHAETPVEEPVRQELHLEFPEQEEEEVWGAGTDGEFVDLGDWLERNRTPASTRMVAHDEEPENDEQKDFVEMLDKFKAGITRNVDEEDFGSHYDLGIAFREMGLLDEAIGSFQKASRGANERVRACEAIGQCFMDKGEAAVTITVLNELMRDKSMSDAQLVGVLYLMGLAAETLSRPEEAAGYYQRVLATQIGFRDAAERLNSLAQTSR